MPGAYGSTLCDMDPQEALALPRAKSCSFDANDALGNLSHVMREAAYGDLTAQRVLRNLATENIFAFGATHIHAFTMPTEVVVSARVCAAHGLPQDARCLAGALCFASDALRHAGHGHEADRVTGEVISILERLAADGDEYSAMASDHLVSLHPAAGTIARTLMDNGR